MTELFVKLTLWGKIPFIFYYIIAIALLFYVLMLIYPSLRKFEKILIVATLLSYISVYAIGIKAREFYYLFNDYKIATTCSGTAFAMNKDDFEIAMKFIDSEEYKNLYLWKNTKAYESYLNEIREKKCD